MIVMKPIIIGLILFTVFAIGNGNFFAQNRKLSLNIEDGVLDR